MKKGTLEEKNNSIRSPFLKKRRPRTEEELNAKLDALQARLDALQAEGDK